MSEELKAALARIACLEGEIAKRDARIMGLESQYQRDVWGLNNEGDPIGGDPAGGYANDNARLRTELAALKAQGVVMPDGWIPLTIEHEPGYPEDVAFGPKRMMDRLKKWLDRYFEMRLNAAPAAPAADASDVLDQAMYTLISIGYHENSGLVHELRQALAANRSKGAM